MYQGEEIGMTNVDYSSLEDFHDVWVANYVKEARSRGGGGDYSTFCLWKFNSSFLDNPWYMCL